LLFVNEPIFKGSKDYYFSYIFSMYPYCSVICFYPDLIKGNNLLFFVHRLKIIGNEMQVPPEEQCTSKTYKFRLTLLNCWN